jgi:hypothetical protein
MGQTRQGIKNCETKQGNGKKKSRNRKLIEERRELKSVNGTE